jgi:hypothetical protein
MTKVTINTNSYEVMLKEPETNKVIILQNCNDNIKVSLAVTSN